MDSTQPQPTIAPQKILSYYRKNYLFGVARPGVLYFDGANFTCYDNTLQPIFSAPVQSVTVKKGFGIFKILINGAQTSILTARGGSTSPAPSKQLLEFLQQPTGNQTTNVLPTAAAGMAAVGGIAGAGAGAVLESVAIIDYIKGQKTLGQFLQSVGLISA